MNVIKHHQLKLFSAGIFDTSHKNKITYWALDLTCNSVGTYRTRYWASWSINTCRTSRTQLTSSTGFFISISTALTRNWTRRGRRTVVTFWTFHTCCTIWIFPSLYFKCENWENLVDFYHVLFKNICLILSG